MARRPHPSPEVEAALAHAEHMGWRVVSGGSHAWGRIYCPFNDACCRCGLHCIASIWSPPRNPGNFAKQVRRLVDNCVRLDPEPRGDIDG